MNTLNSFNNSKQLLIIVPDLVTGGGERVTRELITELASQSYNIRLVSNLTNQLLSQLPLASHRRLDWQRKIQRYKIVASELLRCDSHTNILVVLTGPIILVGLLNLIFGRSVIAYEHSDIEKLYLNSGKYKRKLRLLGLRAAFHSIRRVAVVSDYLCERLPIVIGCDCKKVAVIRNPVQPFLQKIPCKPTSQTSTFLTAYIIGRNSQEKRHREAIELLAASPLVEKIVLVAREATTLREHLSYRAISKLDILESLSEISSFNTNKSFLFSYSIVESYSLVIAEWLASQLKVLTVDNEPMRRLWQHCHGSYFVPEICSIGELETALKHIFDDKHIDARSFFEPTSTKSSGDDLIKLLTN
jgi:glycosyltransferase involved in cell wall biosynthesis